MKEKINKLISITMAFIFALSYFAPIANVYATTNTSLSVTFRDNNNEYGIVQYSLDEGVNWTDIVENANINIPVTGDNINLKIVPNDNYNIDYAGIELELDSTKVSNLSTSGIDSSAGYSIPSSVSEVNLNNVEFRSGNSTTPDPNANTTTNVTVTISGEELEYDAPWSNDAADFVFGINGSQMRYLSKDEVNYTLVNNEIVGLETKNAIEYKYNYNNEGTVTFNIKTQWDDLITSLKINGTEYNTPNTKEALIKAFDKEFRGIRFDIKNVPYADEYEIEVVGRKQTENEKIMGNFGWSYDPNTNEYSDDDKIPYGNLEFVKAVYNNVTYNTIDEINAIGGTFEWKNANKINDPYGEAMFPPGTVLTIKLIPDAGYQLTELTLNGFPFEPGEEPGVYTFTIGDGNWHLGANFEEVNNEVANTANNIKNGNIDLSLNGDDAFLNGTAKLEIKDVENISDNRKEQFINKANSDGYEINSYLDMSLFNTIYKGGITDSNGNYAAWDTQVDNIENDASITLELTEDIRDKKIVLVHETHNGDEITGYELIDTVYNEENNTITFKTNSFSNYAIAIKDSNEKEYTANDSNGNEISFTKEEGHSYKLNIINYLDFTDEDLEKNDIPKDLFNEVINAAKNATKEYGEFIAFLEIEVLDENGEAIHEGPFNIKIKMTDEMKKYNTFKLIYVKVEDDVSIEKPITLKQEGDYLVGTLDHLSTYALTGSVVTNPKTGDKIMTYVFILGLSIAGLLIIGICIKKKKKES